jgi:hypothetical protein
MLSKKLLIGFAAFGLGIATAASDYKVEFDQATKVGGTELKPGEYKLEVQDGKAVFKSGKDVVAQSSVTVENAKRKYAATAVSVNASKLEEIDLGGTTMKIVLPR